MSLHTIHESGRINFTGLGLLSKDCLLMLGVEIIKALHEISLDEIRN